MYSWGKLTHPPTIGKIQVTPKVLEFDAEKGKAAFQEIAFSIPFRAAMIGCGQKTVHLTILMG